MVDAQGLDEGGTMKLDVLIGMIDGYVDSYLSVKEPFKNVMDWDRRTMAAIYLSETVAKGWMDIKAVLEKEAKK